MKTRALDALSRLKQQLRVGTVYRRADLQQWSNAIDRHLRQLLDEGFLKKLSGGLYYRPKITTFGVTPADETMLVETFLKDHRFLLTSPNLYNALGLATTQLYNETVVYNHKRHGWFKLGGRTFRFVIKPHFPSEPTPEFLLVDVVNNLGQLAEDAEHVLKRVRAKAGTMNQRRLGDAVREYGSVRTRKFFVELLAKSYV